MVDADSEREQSKKVPLTEMAEREEPNVWNCRTCGNYRIGISSTEEHIARERMEAHYIEAKHCFEWGILKTRAENR